MRFESKSNSVCRIAVSLALLALAASCELHPPLKTLEERTISLSGGGIEIGLHSLSGRVSSLVDERTGADLLAPWPGEPRQAWLSTEFTDGLSGRTIDPLTDSVLVLDYTATEDSAAFDKRFPAEGYRVDQRVSAARDGIYLDYRIAPEEDTAPLRSVEFTYLLPVQRGSAVWVPGCDDEPTAERGRRRYVYGPGAGDDCRMRLPMISLIRGDGTAYTIAVPLELPVVRVIFEMDPSLAPRGVTPRLAECDWLRITFDLAGAAGDRELHTGLWMYAHEPGWRDALRVFADKYREYFEGRRRLTSMETPLARMEPELPPAWRLAQAQQAEVRLQRLVWNVFHSGEWVPPQAVRFEDFTWRSGIDTTYGEISVNRVRGVIDNLIQFRMRAMLQGAWNSYCEKFTAQSRFGDDIAEDEQGLPIPVGPERLLMHAGPESPFGRAIIEQQRQMLDLYPQAIAYFFPDWDATGIDFAHDDSLTVVHNRPASSISGNRLRVGEALIEMVAGERKLTVTTPPARVVEARGVDMLCITSTDPAQVRRDALLGLWRPVISDPGAALDDLSNLELERLLKEKLLQGVIASNAELARDEQLGRAYRHLFLALAGRTWRLEPIALSLPSDVRGRVYHLPPSSAGGEQELLLCLVQTGVMLADEYAGGSSQVELSFPGAERFNAAAWQPASRSPRTVQLRPSSPGADTVRVTVPPFGPACVVRLSVR